MGGILNRYLSMTAAVGLTGMVVLTGSPAGARTSAVAATPGTWRTAVQVPGTAALNQAGDAGIASVSCASPGNCTAGGFYATGPALRKTLHAFVVSEVRGAWGKAAEVPGTAALNTGGDAEIHAVSCASAGNCSAGGFYTDRSSRAQAFVVSQVKGAWGKAIEVPGSAALNTGTAQITSVSCGSAGNCAAVGFYTARSGNQGFVVSQAGGIWGKARQLPAATLNVSGGGFIYSVSCASAGNCSAGGIYADKAARTQAFVVSQVRGVWGKAIEVPGTAALNVGGAAVIDSVSCKSAGNCSAGGYYANKSGRSRPFVVSQVRGVWRTAAAVPGTAALNIVGNAEIISLSCASAGNCAAGGFYTAKSGTQAFTVSQVAGVWRNAVEVPGTAALNTGRNAVIDSVSCASAGNCGAGGSYTDKAGKSQAFVVSQVRGSWGKAEAVPGSAALNRGGYAWISSVSCASAGNCGAVGLYTDRAGMWQVFVVNQR
jgi:hypothetical protein